MPAQIILAVIVEGFERHVDVANQRVKVTLLQLLRRRLYAAAWQLRGQLSSPKAPKAIGWALQLCQHTAQNESCRSTQNVDSISP